MKCVSLILGLVMLVSFSGCAVAATEMRTATLEPDVVFGGDAAADGAVPTAARVAQLREFQAQYPDAVGWLCVPGTEIDEHVMQSDDNQFYLRRGVDLRFNTEGSYFADYRCGFGTGTAAELSLNTVIYGHSFSEDPDGSRFSQLKAYRGEDFAREHTYIHFSTAAGDMTWEVFAVYATTIDVAYNNPNPDSVSWAAVLANARASSVHDYSHVAVSAQDRVLTLVCPDYSVDSSYPNDYRFVVMARLVD